MFSSLQNGSPVYLLDKATLTLKYGQVTSVGIPKPVLSQPFAANNTTIDVVVSTNGESVALPNVHSHLTVETINGIVIAETREAMSQEVESIQRVTQQVIDNYDAHKQTVERCAELLKELNPKLAKEQQQEKKIENLETSIEEIKKMLSQLMN